MRAHVTKPSPIWAEKIRLPACLPVAAGEARNLYQRTRTTRLHAKTQIFAQGDKAQFIYQVVKGTVGLSTLPANGRRQIIGFAFAGEWFGVGELDHHLYDAEALSAAEIRSIPRALLPSVPHVSAGKDYCENCMCAALTSSLIEHSSLLSHREADAKIAAFLLTIAKRAPQQQIADGVAVELEMRRGDIADFVSLTPESVCRSLAIFEERRIIRFINPRLLCILNTQKLESIAGQN